MKSEQLIPGRLYSIKRITGKVVEFILVEYNEQNRSLRMCDQMIGGHMQFDSLTEKELDSIVEVKRNSNGDADHKVT